MGGSHLAEAEVDRPPVAVAQASQLILFLHRELLHSRFTHSAFQAILRHKPQVSCPANQETMESSMHWVMEGASGD